MLQEEARERGAGQGQEEVGWGPLGPQCVAVKERLGGQAGGGTEALHWLQLVPRLLHCNGMGKKRTPGDLIRQPSTAMGLWQAGLRTCRPELGRSPGGERPPQGSAGPEQ